MKKRLMRTRRTLRRTWFAFALPFRYHRRYGLVQVAVCIFTGTSARCWAWLNGFNMPAGSSGPSLGLELLLARNVRLTLHLFYGSQARTTGDPGTSSLAADK